MRRASIFIAVVIAGCGPDAPYGDATFDADVAMSDGATDATDTPSYARTYLFNLASQAFPDSGHPGALVHVPPGFEAARPFGLVLYVHGFKNCVQNCIEDSPSSCTPMAAPRAAHNLLAQFDALRLQALLVLPEVAYDQSTGAPGQLGTPMGLRAFLDELFTVSLAPVIGPHRVEDLGRIAIVSHSGGYQVAALAASIGGVPQVREIDLLDSLYGEFTRFDDFVTTHIASPAPGPDPYGAWRFASVYTDTGGTAVNNTAMAMRAEGWVSTPDVLRWDDTYATLATAEFAHPLLFKRSELTHDGVVRYYFSRLVGASGFQAIGP